MTITPSVNALVQPLDDSLVKPILDAEAIVDVDSEYLISDPTPSHRTQSTFTSSGRTQSSRAMVGSGDGETLNGTGSNDTIKGKGGDDRINGRGGNDELFGNGGDDAIDGGSGDDVIKGGSGNDKLLGGEGNNTLVGQGGQDIFYLTDDNSYSEIKDFSASADKIVLLPDGGPIPEGDPLTDSGFVPNSGTLFYDSNTGLVVSDPDGPGGQAPIEIAKLPTGINLFDIDFFLYIPANTSSRTLSALGVGDSFQTPTKPSSPFIQVFLAPQAPPSGPTDFTIGL